MYKQASEAGAAGAASGADTNADSAGAGAADDDVVDADFEEVKDKK
jgi:hypothetical protein